MNIFSSPAVLGNQGPASKNIYEGDDYDGDNAVVMIMIVVVMIRKVEDI